MRQYGRVPHTPLSLKALWLWDRMRNGGSDEASGHVVAEEGNAYRIAAVGHRQRAACRETQPARDYFSFL